MKILFTKPRTMLALMFVGLFMTLPVLGNGTITSIASTDTLLWSDTATWGGTLPVAGQEVMIPAETIIKLDVSPPALAGIRIMGTLVFARQDINLTTDFIVVMGRFEIGSETNPFQQKAIITLTGAESEVQVIPHAGNKVLTTGHGTGVISMHGAVNGPTWTRVAQTVLAGSNQLTLQENVGWKVGDRLVIASTDYDANQAEVRFITAVNGNIVTLDQNLNYTHWGATETYNGLDMPMYAEVGNLTRNILIQGDAQSEDSNFGGHAMAHHGGELYVEGVEFFRMGQAGHLARYPIHWHLAGSVTGQYINNNSFHRSYSRSITIHGAHNGLVRGNVSYDILGHAYFMEDGIEQNNVIDNNLGMLIKQPVEADRLVESDKTPAVFWITRPDNIVTNNAAAGTIGGFGIWYDIQEHPTGPSEDGSINNRQVPMGTFTNNVTHSNTRRVHHAELSGGSGLFVEEKYIVEGDIPLFDGLVSYKNQNFGAWMGRRQILKNAAIADNLMGVFGLNSYVQDALIIGITDNKGVPVPGDPVGPNGHVLPAPEAPSWHVYGIRVYDGWMVADNITFANLNPNVQRGGSAVGFRFPKGMNNVLNYFSNITLENATPAFLHPSAANNNLVINHDGSLSKPGSSSNAYTGNNDILIDASSVVIPDLNIVETTGEFLNMYIIRKDNDGNMPKSRLVSQNGSGSSLKAREEPGFAYSGVNARKFDTFTVEWGNNERPDFFETQIRYTRVGDWSLIRVPWPAGKFAVSAGKQVANMTEILAEDENAWFYDAAAEEVVVRPYMDPSKINGIENMDDAGRSYIRITAIEGGNLPPTAEITNIGNNATFAEWSPLHIEVDANDVDGNVTVVKFYMNGNEVGSDKVAPYTLDVPHLFAGEYTLSAKAIDNENAAFNSAEVDFIVNLAPNNFEEGWNNTDVGTASLPGQSGVTEGNTFIMHSSGIDIWNKEDAFQFLYKSMNGNGEIIARVAYLEDNHQWAKTGLMMRSSLASNSKHALLAATPGNGVNLFSRTQDGGSSARISPSNGQSPIQWLRLVREGDIFSAYRSEDGNNWTSISSISISMDAEIFVGLAYASHDITDLGAVAFEDVNLDGSTVGIGNEDVDAAIPQEIELTAAWPNPFNPTTKFDLRLTESQKVTIEVYNALGQRVAVIHNGQLAGKTAHTFTFEAATLPSGMYLIRASGNSFIETRRVVLLK